jgi:phosphate transport system permease protein
MSPTVLFLVLLALAGAAFLAGRDGAVRDAGGDPRRLKSLPRHYGIYVALWCAGPTLAFVVLWLVMQPFWVDYATLAAIGERALELPADQRGLLLNDIRNVALGGPKSGTLDPVLRSAAERLGAFERIGHGSLFVIAVAMAILGLAFARWRIHPGFAARARVERFLDVALIACSLVAILATAGIVASLLFESVGFFAKVPIADFLFGLTWSPQTALRADQVASEGAFGAVPLFAGTLLITLIAMVVAVPVGLMSAIYMAEYAPRRLRDVLKPALEVLAGIPTVVYGFFAALTVAPLVREAGTALGLDVASESALAAGVVMGIMIIPFISSLADDVITAVPQELRDGAYALGATRSETIRQVVVPAALPGIVGGVLLAVSRAIGETMIVVMAAGLAANLTANPLEAVTTVTVQMVTLLVGDQEFDSAKTLAAFALGLTLFCVTLALNVIALATVRRYREKYD